MACILLVDPNKVAKSAMKGILARGGHRFAAVGTSPEAWDFIRRNVKVDLVFVELKLPGESGMALIQRLKNDSFLKLLPVVVYSEHGDRDTLKSILALRVQNFLIKPYREDAIFSEIAKADANPWRKQHFEEEVTFCKMMGYQTEGLHRMLDALQVSLEQVRIPLQKWAAAREVKPILDALTVIAANAETAGAWGVVECVNNLIESAKMENWSEFSLGLERLDFACRLIFRHRNEERVPEDFLSTEELNSASEARARALWFNAPAERRCPVVNWEQLQRALTALPGCPVIDSAAAAFQMEANGHPSCLNPLADLVEKDPGLAAQTLIAVNRLKHQQDPESAPIEDLRLGVGLLGEIRLASQGRGLVTTEERLMHVPPAFSWPQFWMLQTGTARMARYTCRALEFSAMESQAYTAGLLHDLGKLLLLHLHPFGFQAVLEHARVHQVPLREAERLFLGCTTAEMAAFFAEQHGLPRCFANVMRWIDAPEEATQDVELVAVVSIARNLCRHNRVGFDGDALRGEQPSLADTVEWRLLRGSVFPSFDMKKFEVQANADCRVRKDELQGRQAIYAVA